MAVCHFCGECEEEAPREGHNEYCPNQYPVAACREHAIADWTAGFNATEPPTELHNPIYALGYCMGHPRSHYTELQLMKKAEK